MALGAPHPNFATNQYEDIAATYIASEEEFARHNITHDVMLTPAQWEVFESGPNSRWAANDNHRNWQPARFRVVCAGRRFGKTVLALVELLATAARIPNAEVWYIAPNYRQAKTIAWKDLKKLVPPDKRFKINESELSITLANGSTISLKGAENSESLRGVGLHAVVMDEFASMSNEVWQTIIRPMLSDHKGWALFIGTPQGFNHFYEMWEDAKLDKRIDWYAWQFTTEQGGNIDPAELLDAKRDLDARIYAQEYLASFENLTGRVYSAFQLGRNVAEIGDIGGDLLIGMDFNVNPMSALIAVRTGDELHVFDEIELPNSNTTEMSKALIKRYGTRHLTPEEIGKMRLAGEDINTLKRKLLVYPDPSGKARKTSAKFGETDFTILREAGLTVSAPTSAYPVVDRINSVNALFCNANGQVRLFIHPRCRRLIRCLNGLTYKKIAGQDRTTGEPDKTGGLDHMTDALGYLVMGEFPVVRHTVSTKRFI